MPADDKYLDFEISIWEEAGDRPGGVLDVDEPLNVLGIAEWGIPVLYTRARGGRLFSGVRQQGGCRSISDWRSRSASSSATTCRGDSAIACRRVKRA